MKHHYEDIVKRIDESPRWWDEYGAPRYDDFAPDKVADIYAREACLLLIECQGCGEWFEVAMSLGPYSWGPEGLILHNGALAAAAKMGNLHYGDPPNTGCCPAGPTMNSIPQRVLEFWRRGVKHTWERVPGCEVAQDIDWDDGPTVEAA